MKKAKRLNLIVPLNLTDDLAADIKTAVTLTKMSQAEIMRQAIRIGLPFLIQGEKAKAEAITKAMRDYKGEGQ